MVKKLIRRLIVWAGIPLLRIAQRWVKEDTGIGLEIAILLREYDSRRVGR